MRTRLLGAFAVAGCGFLVLMGQAAAKPAVFTAAQAAAGRTAYLSSCVNCHTDALVGHDGTGEIPEFLRPYGGKIPPLAGANAAYPPFLAKWGPRTTSDLSRRIQEAVGGFPPDGRNAETYLNLTAYVLEMNGAKPGAGPLTAATSVRIESLTAPR